MVEKNQTQTHNNAVNSTAATAAQHGRLRNSRAARPAEVAVNYVVGAIRETPHVGYNAPLRGCTKDGHNFAKSNLWKHLL